MWYSEIQGLIGGPGTLVIIAAALQAFAHLVTHQLGLRVLLLCGTILYLTYYFIALDTPLWPAIFATSAIGITTVYGLIRLLINRSRFLMSADEIAILNRFPGLEPGVFRRLLKLGHIRPLLSDEPLAIEGEVPEKLFYLLSGNVKVTKSQTDFEVSDSTFIGEVSMVNDIAATATVSGIPNTLVIEWDRRTLAARMAKDHHLRLAVEGLFTRDLARKLAQAVKVDQTKALPVF